MTDHPTRSVEVEVTFDVDRDTALADWTAVRGVESVTGPEVRSLDALYLDSADGALARNGVAIRRRTGGPDAGWHLKGPLVDGARVELHWPLTDAEHIPASVREAAARYTDATLVPLARIRNERHAYLLRDAHGEILAEMVDDHVDASDLRADVEREWREWEIELMNAAPTDVAARAAFFSDVADCAHRAGARPASSASKLARTLGH